MYAGAIWFFIDFDAHSASASITTNQDLDNKPKIADVNRSYENDLGRRLASSSLAAIKGTAGNTTGQKFPQFQG